MKKYRLGLVCSMKNKSFTTNKSFKKQSLSKEKLFDTVKHNLYGLENIAKYCHSVGITTLRLGNAVVPFASHDDFEQGWWDELEPLLLKTKDTISSYNLRLTIHPGQFIQLGSKNPKVVNASLKELRYCDRVLELLGGSESVICLHVGGKMGDSEATMERFYEVFSQNLWLQKRLALENDEKNFNAKQTLTLCNRCKIPMIFDIFHHSINSSEISWKEIKSSWKKKRPKLHISSQGDGPIGMHAPMIRNDDFKDLKEFLGEDIFEVDVMVEAKAKEEAIAEILALQ